MLKDNSEGLVSKERGGGGEKVNAMIRPWTWGLKEIDAALPYTRPRVVSTQEIS